MKAHLPTPPAFRPRVVSALVASFMATTAALAQGGKSAPVQEFTRQGLLIPNFGTEPTGDNKLSRRAADAVRSRVYRLANKKEVEVIDEGDVDETLERAGYSTDGPPDMEVIRTLAKRFRVDEFVVGTARGAPDGFHLRADIVLYRDIRIRQPIAEVVAPKLDSAADLMARAISAARGQMVHQRRCENAIRDGKYDVALVSAREGVATYPRSTVARTCLLWSLRGVGAPPSEVVSVARQLLSIDAKNVHAIEAAAVALDRLGRPAESADMWIKLAQSDTADLDLATRVAFALVDGGNAKRAEGWLVSISDAHRDHLPLLGQKWRATYENKSWVHAIEAGEALLTADSSARRDSTFFVRLATAYRAAGHPYKAIETLARAVNTFRGDARLYSMYTQYIRAEADTVVPRGLALFPNSADLLAINARDLHTRGKLQESLDATRRVASLDSSLAQTQLTIAQLEIELGRPDSALVTLHSAVTRGEDSATVARFALSKGNALYQAANGTHASGDFMLALRYLTFSDSVRPSTQSRFLVGAAALGVAQSALTEAPKSTDKTESCRLAKLGAEMVPMARTGLQAGQDVLPEAAKQQLDYLDTLDPYVVQQIAAFCTAAAP